MADEELVNPRARGRGRGAEDPGVPGHVTRAGPAGLAFHCPACDAETLYTWARIEQAQAQGRDPHAELNTVKLPQCACGATSFLTIDEHEDLDPEGDDAITRRAVHEHVMPRVGHLGLRIARPEKDPRAFKGRPDAREVVSAREPTVESQVGVHPGPDGVRPGQPDQGWERVGPERAGGDPGVPGPER